MRMTHKMMFATASAIALLSACSDSPVAPTGAAMVKGPSLAVGDSYTPTPAVVLGRIVVCKAGNAGGSFDVTGALAGGAHTANFAGLDFAIATGTCRSVAEDFSTDIAVGSNVTISEDAAANTVGVVTACRFMAAGSAEQNCTNATAQPRFINSYHGYVVTYTNTFTPPPPPPPQVCDFTTFGGQSSTPKLTYGGNAGFASEGFAYGDLNFVNHETGDKIHVWNVTFYGAVTVVGSPLYGLPNARIASGLGEVNGVAGIPVEFRFADLGEPGTSDQVYLKVGNNVIVAQQVINNGNIQFHDHCKKAPKAEKH